MQNNVTADITILNVNNHNSVELCEIGTDKVLSNNWTCPLVHFTANDWNVFVYTANT